MEDSLCLVTELLARGSLDDVIMACTKDGNYTLDWTKRIEFAVDACHGISCLSHTLLTQQPSLTAVDRDVRFAPTGSHPQRSTDQKPFGKKQIIYSIDLSYIINLLSGSQRLNHQSSRFWYFIHPIFFCNKDLYLNISLGLCVQGEEAPALFGGTPGYIAPNCKLQKF